MLETPHSLVGGAIGAAVGAAGGNPWLAAPAGIASHLAGDLVPHWNPSYPFTSRPLYAFVLADFAIAMGLVVGFALAFPNRPEIVIGAFFGTVPDILLGLRYTFKIRWLQAYERIHARFQWEVPLVYGLWPQLILSSVSGWYLAGL